jgi:Putative transmembrane protein (PGPGW)
MQHVMRMGRRIGIAIAGGVVTLLGVVLSVPLVPGPGLVFVVLGLAILSLEFERPRVWLAHLKAKGVELKRRLASKRSRSGGG